MRDRSAAARRRAAKSLAAISPDSIEEDHGREQFFFSDESTALLASIASRMDTVCCLCTPMVGKALVAAGRSPVILDIDARFAGLPGWHPWDLTKPARLDQRFDLIVFDPPFFKVSLKQLRAAVDTLCHHDTTQPLLLAWIQRRAEAALRAFDDYGLEDTGIELTYRTLRDVPENRVHLYANLPVPPGLTAQR